MRPTLSRARPVRPALTVLVTGVVIAGCGGGGAAKPTTLSLSIAEQGKAAKFTVPASAKGGLTHVVLTNSGKQPHGAQLILVTGGHTVADAVKVLGTKNNNKTPTWMRAEGGVGTAPPGQSLSATVNLPKGTYAVIDTASLGNGGPSSGAPPTYTQLKLTGGKRGAIKRQPAHIIGTQTGKDHYAWRISGLKAGTNTVEFTSKGKQALHLVTAVKLKGNANPSLGAIKKALQSNGPPPSYIDTSAIADTAALDGGKSLTTSLRLQSGRYVVFCPLTDRDGGKPHFLEGMLAKTTVP